LLLLADESTGGASGQSEAALSNRIGAHPTNVSEIIELVGGAIAVVIQAIALLVTGADDTNASGGSSHADGGARLTSADIKRAAWLADGCVIHGHLSDLIGLSITVIVETIADLNAIVGDKTGVLAAIEGVPINVMGAYSTVSRWVKGAISNFTGGVHYIGKGADTPASPAIIGVDIKV
jgi:hypothetical protein